MQMTLKAEMMRILPRKKRDSDTMRTSFLDFCTKPTKFLYRRFSGCDYEKWNVVSVETLRLFVECDGVSASSQLPLSRFLLFSSADD